MHVQGGCPSQHLHADYKYQMRDVYTTSVNLETIDEAPSAYKDTDSILEAVGQTCTIHYRMLPRINVKAADEKPIKKKLL